MAKTTTTDLISQIKLQGSFPSSDSLFSNSNFLSLLNLEMLKEVVPLLNKVNEEYFLESEELVLTANKKFYRIPTRAIGSALRDIQILNSDNTITQLARLYEEDRTSLDSNSQGYFLKGNQVEVSPMPTDASGSLKLLYFRRPSTFVLPSTCSKISSIDFNLNQVVVESVPSTFTTGTEIDFVQSNSPYDLLEMNSEILNISGTTITFSESLSVDLQEGDYICLAGETCTPMIPEELIPILVQAALCTALSSKKDKSVEFEIQKLQQMKDSILQMLVPRVSSNDKKIVSKNGLF